MVTAEIAGVSVSLDKGVFDDLELLDMLDDIDGGNGLKLMKCMRKVFGADWQKVADAISESDGRIPVEPAARAFAEAIKAVGKGN